MTTQNLSFLIKKIFLLILNCNGKKILYLPPFIFTFTTYIAAKKVNGTAGLCDLRQRGRKTSLWDFISNLSNGFESS